MLDIARSYLRAYSTPETAMREFALDLQRGDPDKFKAGYTRENAIIATAEAFDSDYKAVERLVP